MDHSCLLHNIPKSTFKQGFDSYYDPNVGLFLLNCSDTWVCKANASCNVTPATGNMQMGWECEHCLCENTGALWTDGRVEAKMWSLVTVILLPMLPFHFKQKSDLRIDFPGMEFTCAIASSIMGSNISTDSTVRCCSCTLQADHCIAMPIYRPYTAMYRAGNYAHWYYAVTSVSHTRVFSLRTGGI